MDSSVWSGARQESIVLGEGPGVAPRGVVDLRGAGCRPGVLRYPAGAVVVVSGLPGSGKSTLLGRWSRAARVIDPRRVHLACEAVMPTWLPYAVYRPWARWRYFRWLRSAVRGGGPLLVHDCGGRPWMRRWLSRTASRQGRELHLVLLDVGVAEALSGQAARGRRAPQRAFARHHKGLGRLLQALTGSPATDGGMPTTLGPPPTPGIPAAGTPREAASVVLLDRHSREHVRAVVFSTVGGENA